MAQAAMAFAPDGGTLADFDSRDPAKAAAALAGAQAKLERRLGEEGFADASVQEGALSFVGRTDGFLTNPTDARPVDVALAYVGAKRAAFGLDAGDLARLELTSRYTSLDGVTHLTFSQLSKGVPSYDSALYANVTKDGRLINLSGAPLADLRLQVSDPELNAKDALMVARANVHGQDGRRFGELESARRVAFAHPDGDAALAWAVYVEADSGLYEVVVGADSGKVLARESRTHALNDATVWNNHPDQTVPPITVNLGADPSWIDDTAGGTRLKGNNAHAYADVGGVNGVDPGEDIAQAGGNWQFATTFFNHAGCPPFGCTWDSDSGATKATNQPGAITGLFYLVNRFHDHLLAAPIGFDEASGNFERVNSSGLGLGNDSVLAEGNDASGTNNANFSVPPDGTPGRMQQFFWSVDWDVTGSDSAEVVYHEYTHGLTNRLVGNAAGLGGFQPRAMDEGWADWYANDFLVATGEKSDGPGEDLTLGEYVIDLFGVGGIRRQRMDCKPGSAPTFCPSHGTAGAGGFTFGDLGTMGSSSHDSGEIWSQTLWDLREAIGSNDARAMVTGGLRLTPVNPTFLQARDAILQSALVQGIPRGPIWEVFAARGMGLSASTPGANAMTATEAFDVPGMSHVATDIADPPPLGDGDGFVEPGETVRITETLENSGSDTVTGVSGTLATATPGILLGSDQSSWPDFTPVSPPQVNDPPFTATIPESAPCGSSVELTIDVTSSAGPIAVPEIELPLGERLFTTASPNLAIPDNTPAGVNATINLPATPIADLDVSIDQLTHTFDGDLRVTLTSPAATTVVLMNRPGSGAGGANADGFQGLVLDDEAGQPIEGIASGTGPVTGRFTPDEPLSAFDGENAGGVWTLNVSDNAAADTGTLNTWGLGGQFECDTSVTLPTAATSPATAIGHSTATLNGQIDAKGAQTGYAFDWGTTAAYGERTPAGDVGSATGPLARAADLTGLTPDTTYHYRAIALRDGEVVAQGADQTFTTLPPDTTRPETTITKKPKKKTTKRKAKFKYTANEPTSTFMCRLDKKRYKACGPRFKKKVKPGKHKFFVFATDLAQNADDTPAKWKWRVLKP